MFVKNIRLTNYRNYESLDLDLGRKTTLFIGKNGVGKTNLITALKQSLSFIFSGNSNISQKDFVADTMQKIKSFEVTDAARIINEGGVQNKIGSWPVKIDTTLDIDEESPLTVTFSRENLSEGMKESYSSASIRYWRRYSNLHDLPVLAFYSDSFPHEKVKIGTKIQKQLDSEFGISQPAGYYNWDDPRDCSSVWLQFFIQQWKNHKYGNEKNNEAEYIAEISNCMSRFSQSLENAEKNNDFELNEITVVARGKGEVVVLKFKDGIETDFESLPAGFRRAFSMAFDLANRSFLLNKNCDPEGIAFIDEIDLHLHPSLAQEILERIQNTFPRMQFIVSTHSPLVLSNFKQDGNDAIVYNLKKNDNYTTTIQKIDYSYGIDYNTLLVDLMGTKVRNTILRKYIKDYLYWKNVEEIELAEKIKKQILELVGPDSELAKKLNIN